MAAISKSNMADLKGEFRLPSGPKISENVRTSQHVNVHVWCAKFGACIRKCTILLNISNGNTVMCCAPSAVRIMIP